MNTEREGNPLALGYAESQIGEALMARPRSDAQVRRELRRLLALQGDRRRTRTRENYLLVTGAIFALQWAVGVPNARAVALIIRDRVKGPA